MTATRTSKITALLQSRKFWALITSLVGLGVATYYHGMPVDQAILAAVAALSLYSVGTAIEDNGNTPPATVIVHPAATTSIPTVITTTSGGNGLNVATNTVATTVFGPPKT